tara:strand:- start:214 stop:522 length:309 start_codon:yes stop_codon:yes gene_type:complete
MTDKLNNITDLESSILSLQKKASFINEKIKLYNRSSGKKSSGLNKNPINLETKIKTKVQVLEEKLDRELKKSKRKQKTLVFMAYMIIILLSLLIFSLEINFI